MKSDFYGALPQRTLDSDLDAHLEELSIQGFTVMPDVVREPELTQLREKLARAYEAQKAEVGPDFTLEDIQEENQVRAPVS